MLGDSSNVQIFLGGMVCVCWLCLVVWKRPYTAYWDNALSAALSFQLLIIILSGMALEIYRLTPSYAQDPYQRSAFGLFMVVASVLVIASSFFIIFISVPCARNFVFAKCTERCLGEGARSVADKGVAEHHVELAEISMPKDTPVVGRARNGAERQRKRRISKLSTGSEMEYCIPEDGGASASNLPDDAEVCEINPMSDSAEIGAFNKQRKRRFSKPRGRKGVLRT